jgi:prepilin-type N-terminal cleavage/methylation domain-containing protein
MNKKGVTLLELIIVFVIIAIMAAFILPGIGSNWLPRYRLRSATRDIVSTMRTAQIRAISNNLTYRVNLNAGDMGVNNYVLQYTTAGIWVNEGAVQSLPSGISIIANTLPGNYANFNPNSTASAGSVTLGNTKGATKNLSVTSGTGRIIINW